GVPRPVSNNTREDRGVSLKLTEHPGLELLRGPEDQEFTVPAGKPLRKVYRFQPTLKEGEARLTFEGKTAPFAADAVRTAFRVVPEGFPILGSHSELLEGSASHTIELPQGWVKGPLKYHVAV